MIQKIGQTIEPQLNGKIITKTFQRGLQTITSKVATYDGKVYFKSWRLDEYKHVKKYSQAYSDNKPIKGSKSIIDFYV